MLSSRSTKPKFDNEPLRYRDGSEGRSPRARRRSLSRIIPVRSSTGRISQGPIFTPGWFDMIWTAWLRSRASMIRSPPRISLVSTKGPSVAETVPFW